MFVDTISSEGGEWSASVRHSEGGGGCARHIKGLGMLVVLLRGVNFGFGLTVFWAKRYYI